MTELMTWDLRSEEERELSKIYEKDGYVIHKGDKTHLDNIRHFIYEAYLSFISETGVEGIDISKKLQLAHSLIEKEKSNDLRLHIMKELSLTNQINREYFLAAKESIYQLCGNELAMQKRVGLSINLPQNPKDVLPIHADTWNGVSPYELNIWIPIVDCKKTMCLYILKREDYIRKLEAMPHLLQLSSDDLYITLQDSLTWIEIKYGEVLAFDQSLPHGYAINEEDSTHWSLNCRFKGLHTPYWDKKLGEYFMPITARSCTRLGLNYQHPDRWL